MMHNKAICEINEGMLQHVSSVAVEYYSLNCGSEQKELTWSLA